MNGTVINAIGIIIGSLIGLLLKRGIPPRINEAVLRIEGFAVVIIGLNGVLTTMLYVDPATGSIKDSGGLLLFISLVIGCIAGEALKIDDRINRLGMRVESGFKADGFSKGFVTASLLFSIGSMSIMGPLNNGLTGDAGILYIKTMLDGTASVFLASALGFGVLFACVPVFIVQCIPALLARQLAPFLSDILLSNFCMVGYSTVICIGFNLFTGAKIKVANLLPSLLVPVIYYFARAAIGLPLR